ncbi:efflux RND transporter periplasmic adaptor subunit [Haloferula sargassicola]|uniref:Multidrug resistance protein MdtA n=1 Tax=Haloferula sargassicola TaxID=490096 RepID=A0ABP9UKA1_9BACT
MKPSPLLAAALSLGLLAACGKRGPEAAEPEPLPTTTVQVQPVKSRPHAISEDIVGTVRSKHQATVEAKVSGRIERYLVATGQAVKSGDLIAEIDASEIGAKVEAARATSEQASRELDRYQRLLKSHAVTRQDYENIDARERVARAGLAEAETMLGHARVTAPFDGVVTAKLAEVGDLAMPGKPLARIEAPEALRFEADLPEALLGKVSLDDTLRVTFSGTDPIAAKVSEVAPVADSVSRTFRIKLDLPADAALRAGMFGRVAVPVAESDALAIPATAILQRGQMECAFVIADGHAWLRLVKTGQPLGEDVEILSGLEAGETIAIDPGSRMIDGQPVEVAP